MARWKDELTGLNCSRKSNGKVQSQLFNHH